MRIFLARPGESMADLDNVYCGAYNVMLSPKGLDQARILRDEWKDNGIERIFHSPLIRAEQTAVIVDDDLKVGTQHVDHLREWRRYGLIAGFKKENAAQTHPQDVKHLEKSWYNHQERGESYADFQTRMALGMSLIHETMAAGHSCVGIVAHSGFVRCFLETLAGLTPPVAIEEIGYAVVDYDSSSFDYEIVSLHRIETDSDTIK